VRDFYASYFVGHWPRDTEINRLSRTVDEERVVDELVISFTHDVSMPAILPGVAPTGRHVVLPFVVVVGFEDGKVAYEHIYWDQASMLVQIGMLDPAGLPVSGAEQAHQLHDPTRPANALIRRAGVGSPKP
jgi:carboxymethylenebutenolidase